MLETRYLIDQARASRTKRNKCEVESESAKLRKKNFLAFRQLQTDGFFETHTEEEMKAKCIELGYNFEN